MDRKSNSNTFALVSGIMLALCGMIILIQSIRYGGFDSDIGLEVFSLLGLAAALFLKKHEAVLGMALVSALSILILVIKYSLVFFTPITAYLLSYVFLALLAFISLCKNSLLKYTWFVPVIFIVLCFFQSIITYGYFQDIRTYGVLILTKLMQLFGILFASLWLKSEYIISDSSSSKAAEAVPPLVGNADRLKMYKSLLDCGAITEEEFQTKKAELLKR